MGSKYDLNVTPDQILTTREGIPPDYHCQCSYCRTSFLGEIFNAEKNMYYSQAARNRYVPKKDNVNYPHNNPGHWPGYRFAIQQLTQPGDLVFDPTVGTGTAIIEAHNNGRIGMGIELEFPKSTRYYTEGRGTVISGNALTEELDIPEESIQLLVNGTPYPVISGGQSSDVPSGIGEQYGDYRHEDNIGKWGIKEYSNRIHELYSRYIPFIKKCGYICIIIKDPISKKMPFPLHTIIADSIISNNEGISPYGWFVHRHIPPTLFINAYEANEGIKCPVLYQTAVILKKDG